MTRTLADHLEDAMRWTWSPKDGKTYVDPMQMTGWRPTMAVLLARIAELEADVADLTHDLTQWRGC